MSNRSKRIVRDERSVAGASMVTPRPALDPGTRGSWYVWLEYYGRFRRDERVVPGERIDIVYDFVHFATSLDGFVDYNPDEFNFSDVFVPYDGMYQVSVDHIGIISRAAQYPTGYPPNAGNPPDPEPTRGYFVLEPFALNTQNREHDPLHQFRWEWVGLRERSYSTSISQTHFYSMKAGDSIATGGYLLNATDGYLNWPDWSYLLDVTYLGGLGGGYSSLE